MKKFSFLLTLLFCAFICTQGFSQGKIPKDKRQIISILEGKKNRLVEISDNIWEAAEPALWEFKSSK